MWVIEILIKSVMSLLCLVNYNAKAELRLNRIKMKIDMTFFVDILGSMFKLSLT